MNLTDIKAALIAALDMRAGGWDNMKSLRLDVRFRSDGSINEIDLAPVFQVAVRGRCPALTDYDFMVESTGAKNRLTG